MPARLIRNEIMVPSHPRLLCTALSVPQPSSVSRPEPRLTDCRLATMVGSRERTCLRRAPCFRGQKNEIRSASRCTSCISAPRVCVGCGQSWPTRLGDPWATETDRALASCRSSSQAGNSNQRLEHTLLHENSLLQVPGLSLGDSGVLACAPQSGSGSRNRLTKNCVDRSFKSSQPRSLLCICDLAAQAREPMAAPDLPLPSSDLR